MGFARALLALSVVTVSVLAVEVQTAKAEMFIEPFIGYEAGQLKATTSGQTAGWTTNATGMDLGARLGYSLPLLWFGLDYTYGMVSTSGMSGTAAPSDGSNSKRTSLAAVAGVKVPLFRVYVGYGLMDNFSLSQSSGNIDFSGQSVKGGVSFSGLPFIFLNLEYIMATYTTVSPSNYSSASSNRLMASASMQF